MSPPRQPEKTRRCILQAAFDLFHSCSFRGTSVNQIVDEAGITKGALFHHFKGKNELGYAVVDEILMSEIGQIWVEGLRGTTDPIASIKGILQRFGEELAKDPEFLRCGCPINNLTQEMSAVDEVFRSKLMAVYEVWITALEEAFRAGIAAGTVRAGLNPRGLASMVVSLFEGSAGLIKVNLNDAFIAELGEGMNAVLDGLKP